MDYKELHSLQESYNAMFSEQVTSTTHDWKRGTTKPPKAPTLPPPSGKETNSLPSRTPENAKNVRYYKDDVDLFDIVKGHLMSEGYADTEGAALAIMANMSEAWKQSILEDEQSSADARQRNKRTQDALDRRSSDVVPPAPKLPPAPPERSTDKKGPTSPGGAPAPRSGGSVGRIPPRNNGGGSVGRNNGGGQIRGNTGSPGTIGTIQGGKPGDGYLGPTVRIGNTTIGIPNPSPIRRGGGR